MFLTTANLYSYLSDVGLVTPNDILDDDFTISEIGRRNRNFRTTRASGQALFIKQVPAVIAETILSFQREAACGQLAAEAPPASAMRSISPLLRRYDPKWHVLVYDALQDSESLSELIARLGAIPESLPERLARTLAAVHLETMRPGALTNASSVLTGEPPWIFIIGERAETVMPNMSEACRQVVAQIRRTPELLHGLAQLGQQWRRICLMHGDIKSDNVLITAPAGGEREIRLVDWELANLGEPLWDAAGFLCMFLQQWIFSLRLDAATQQGSPQTSAYPPLDAVRHNAAAFWSAYLDAMRGALPGSDDATARVGYLTAARLVLLTFELLPSATAISPHATIALQLARYLMADGQNALRDLLGITANSTAAMPARAAIAEPWKIPAGEA